MVYVVWYFGIGKVDFEWVVIFGVFSCYVYGISYSCIDWGFDVKLVIWLLVDFSGLIRFFGLSVRFVSIVGVCIVIGVWFFVFLFLIFWFFFDGNVDIGGVFKFEVEFELCWYVICIGDKMWCWNSIFVEVGYKDVLKFCMMFVCLWFIVYRVIVYW